MDQPVARWLSLAQGLLERPTAPLVEDLPRAHVGRFAREAADGVLATYDDAAGNVVVRYQGAGAAGPPLVLVAHLDHPGFSVDRVDDDHAALTFHGGLTAEHAAAGSPVHLFERGALAPCGAGELVDASEADGRLQGAVARRTRGRLPWGGYAMWGFPGWSLEAGRIMSRACDDLLGAALALCTLDELARSRPAGAVVWGLFTRAEELGFYGALEAIRLGTVPADATVLSLECSKALPHAPQGGGVIVRVGDRASVFDPDLTGALTAAAERVAAQDGSFRWQRKLMDGGACEATAFCLSGYRASGVALPLGNYHNAATGDDGRPRVGPEHVLADDFTAGVRLLVEVATDPACLAPGAGARSGWLERRAQAARQALGAG